MSDTLIRGPRLVFVNQDIAPVQAGAQASIPTVRPVLRLEVLLRLEAPASFHANSVPFGEGTVRDYVQDWIDTKASAWTRLMVFQDSTPEIEEVMIVEDLISYRSVMLRLWNAVPKRYESGIDLAKAKADAHMRLEHVFYEWLDSGWDARTVMRLRAMSGERIPLGIQHTARKLNLWLLPYAPPVVQK